MVVAVLVVVEGVVVPVLVVESVVITALAVVEIVVVKMFAVVSTVCATWNWDSTEVKSWPQQHLSAGIISTAPKPNLSQESLQHRTHQSTVSIYYNSAISTFLPNSETS